MLVGKLFLMQIKSKSILKEDKKALLIPMEIDENIEGIKDKVVHDALIRDAIKLYPQYTRKEDKPVFTISELTMEEYTKWKETNVWIKYRMLVGGRKWNFGSKANALRLMFAGSGLSFSKEEFENEVVYSNGNTRDKLTRMNDSIRRAIDLYYQTLGNL